MPLLFENIIRAACGEIINLSTERSHKSTCKVCSPPPIPAKRKPTPINIETNEIPQIVHSRPSHAPPSQSFGRCKK